MQRLRRLEAEAAHIELLDDVQHLQCRQALRVGGHPVHIHAAIVRHQRLNPLGMVLAQILRREPAADALEVGVDGLGNGAVVERVAAALGDHAVGAREVGIAAHVVLIRSDAARHVGFHCVGCLLHSRGRTQKDRHVALDVVADDLRRGIARLAGGYCRLEQLSPLQLSVALVQRPPAVERAGS